MTIYLPLPLGTHHGRTRGRVCSLTSRLLNDDHFTMLHPRTCHGPHQTMLCHTPVIISAMWRRPIYPLQVAIRRASSVRWWALEPFCSARISVSLRGQRPVGPCRLMAIIFIPDFGVLSFQAFNGATSHSLLGTRVGSM